MKKPKATLQERLQAKQEQTTVNEKGCWEASTPKYPQIYYQGMHLPVIGAYLLQRGIDISDRHIVAMHTCDNRRCINPDHIVAGTASQNTKDGYKRGRVNAMRKLTFAQVQELRQKYQSGIYTQKDLREMYGISKATTAKIISGFSYKEEGDESCAS